MMDHPLRHMAQNLLAHLPGIDTLQRLRGTTGAMNDPAVMDEWSGYIERDVTAAGKTVAGSTFLEVGPGHSIGVALNLLKGGAKGVYAVDVREYVDVSTIAPDLRPRFHYSVVNDEADWSIKPESIDVVYSYFSGEHLRYPGNVVREMARALRKDGMCIFAVDLMDHAHRDSNWLQFLYYEPRTWDAMFSRRGAWTNRLREPDWRSLFEKHFGNVEIKSRIEAMPEGFDRNRLAPSFQRCPESALPIASIWIVATSPK